MGLFKKDKTVVPYEVVKPLLAPKDDFVHVMMLNSWSTWSTLTFKCDEEYIGETNAVIMEMQHDGYEIVGIQHNSISNGSGLGMLAYTTLITYR